MLYHLTEQENVESILQNGLIPRIGRNSASVEDRPVVCLSAREHLGFWRIILNIKHPAVLRVKDPNNMEYKDYGLYKEYRTYDAIPKYDITLADINEELYRSQDMSELCLSYLDTLSELCRRCAVYYTHHKVYTEKQLKRMMENMLRLLERADFSVLTNNEIITHLKEHGEQGEYTFCDTYRDTDKRLYQLSMYPEDGLLQTRIQLEQFIASTFAQCMIDTGGWTG